MTKVLSLEEMQRIFATSTLDPKPTFEEHPDVGDRYICVVSTYSHPQLETSGSDGSHLFGNAYIGDQGRVGAYAGHLAYLLEMERKSK